MSRIFKHKLIPGHVVAPALALLFWATRFAEAQTHPFDVRVENAAGALVATSVVARPIGVYEGTFEPFLGSLFTDSPGFIVEDANSGDSGNFAAGDKLGFNIVRKLYFWDGWQLTATSSGSEALELRSGALASSVAQTDSSVAGFNFGTADPFGGIHQHLGIKLSPSDAQVGLYGVVLELTSAAPPTPGRTPTTPILFALDNGLFESDPAGARKVAQGVLAIAADVGIDYPLRWDPDAMTPGVQGGSGTWNTAGISWQNNTRNLFWRNNTSYAAQFCGTGGTVTVETVTAYEVRFDAPGYVLDGGALTLSGAKVVANHDATINSTVINADVLTKTGAATLTLGAIQNQGTDPKIDVTNGALSLGSVRGAPATLTVANGASVSLQSAFLENRILGAIDTNTSGTLDIKDGAVIVDYSGTSPYISLTAQLKRGINLASGFWNGTGIISSNAAADGGPTAIGIIEASDLALLGRTSLDDPQSGTDPLDADSIVLKYTYWGDADVDGDNDVDDFIFWSSAFPSASGATWFTGDFDYDGDNDVDDFVFWSSTFPTLAPPLGSVSPVIATVPEPGTAALIAIGVFALCFYCSSLRMCTYVKEGLMKRSNVALLFLIAVSMTAIAHAQHADILVGVDGGRIITGAIEENPDPQPPTITPGVRVFGGELGETMPNFSNEPGFDTGNPGPFTPGANVTVGFNILDSLHKWNGTDFSMVPAEQIEIGFLGLVTPVATLPAPGTVDGFSLPLSDDPNGEWHRHWEFALTNPASTGVYLLSLELKTSQNGVGNSLPFWIVFNQNDTEENHDAAIDYQISQVPEPATIVLSLAGLAGLVMIRKKVVADGPTRLTP